MSNPRKQHVHRWELRITKGSMVEIKNNPFTNFGFDVYKYYVCIRGGKIKHTLQYQDWFEDEMWKKFAPKKTIRVPVTVQASGLFNFNEKA